MGKQKALQKLDIARNLFLLDLTKPDDYSINFMRNLLSRKNIRRSDARKYVRFCSLKISLMQRVNLETFKENAEKSQREFMNFLTQNQVQIENDDFESFRKR